jgi:hypothetical protein
MSIDYVCRFCNIPLDGMSCSNCYTHYGAGFTWYYFTYLKYQFIFYNSNNFVLCNTIQYKKILDLDYHPNITPFNVAEKMKTILVFS